MEILFERMIWKLCSHPLGQSVVTWPHLLQEARKCSLYSSRPHVQIKFKEGENGY